jgi:hypothetical protein
VRFVRKVLSNITAVPEPRSLKTVAYGGSPSLCRLVAENLWCILVHDKTHAQPVGLNPLLIVPRAVLEVANDIRVLPCIGAINALNLAYVERTTM